MGNQVFCFVAFGTILAVGAVGQTNSRDRANVPIYQVTVIERTVKAVNYHYRNGETKIDFRGSILLPHSKGEAAVESKPGRTAIDARFENLPAPTRYGPEYLTYVLWAITPDGHAKNLGEIIPDGSDKGKIEVTTDLQAFGMIVSAEPYSAVRRPSDVVVMENEIRPDTVGRIQPIQAKYELLPRGEYTYTVPADIRSANESGRRLPMDQYESLLEVYQAQNAVQIAKASGADRYAAETFEKADRMLRDAQALQARKAGRTAIVTAAREAAQTAEDARLIAQERKRTEELATLKDQAARDRALAAKAGEDARQARDEAAAARDQLERERAARERAEAEAAAGARQQQPPPAPAPPMAQIAPPEDAPQQNTAKSELRMFLLQQLNADLEARDTPRGLMIVIPDASFQGAVLQQPLYSALSKVSTALSAHAGLTVDVEGSADSEAAPAGQTARERAEAVRSALVRGGLPAQSVAARGIGNTRPVASNASPSGREQNRRVEILISGDAIGVLPYWTKSYSLVPKQ